MAAPAPCRAKKFFVGVIYSENLYVHPQHTQVHLRLRQSKSRFLVHFLLGGEDLEMGVIRLVVLDRLLRATTK